MSPGVAVRRWLGRAARTVGAVTLSMVEVVARVEAERPPNWPSGLVTLARAYPLVNKGIPVIWVPDSETLSELVAAPGDAGRQEVLKAHGERVVAHAHEVLDEVTAPDLVAWRDLVRQALDCVLEYPAPAQALGLQAAPVIGMYLHGDAKHGQLYRRAATLAASGPVRPPGALRSDLTTVVFATVLARFNPGDRTPSTPNRNAIAHALSDEQYTDGNAISAVLLAVSVLRQAQAQHEAHEPAHDGPSRPSL